MVLIYCIISFSLHGRFMIIIRYEEWEILDAFLM